MGNIEILNIAFARFYFGMQLCLILFVRQVPLELLELLFSFVKHHIWIWMECPSFQYLRFNRFSKSVKSFMILNSEIYDPTSS